MVDEDPPPGLVEWRDGDSVVLPAGREDVADSWNAAAIVRSLRAGHRAYYLQSGSTLLGYAVLGPLPDVMELLHIAIISDYRSKGYGALLLRYLEEISLAAGHARMWLEVRESNYAARALYRSAGYRPVGRRRGYYPRPGENAEDAILMEKDLRDPGKIDPFRDE